MNDPLSGYDRWKGRAPEDDKPPSMDPKDDPDAPWFVEDFYRDREAE